MFQRCCLKSSGAGQGRILSLVFVRCIVCGTEAQTLIGRGFGIGTYRIDAKGLVGFIAFSAIQAAGVSISPQVHRHVEHLTHHYYSLSTRNHNKGLKVPALKGTLALGDTGGGIRLKSLARGCEAVWARSLSVLGVGLLTPKKIVT